MKPRLRVVAAALFDVEGRVLIAQRPEGKHMAGWWEFPGGKVAQGESDRDALERELLEELGVKARAQRALTTMSHEYPDRIVDLVLWQASIESGEPRGLDGQRLQWVDCQSLGSVGLLPADLPLIPVLQGLSSRDHRYPDAQTKDRELYGR